MVYLNDAKNTEDVNFLSVIFNAKGDTNTDQMIDLANMLVMRLLAKRNAELDDKIKFDSQYIQGSQPEVLREYLGLSLDLPQKRAITNWKNMVGIVVQNSVRVSPRAGVGGALISQISKNILDKIEDLCENKMFKSHMQVFAHMEKGNRFLEGFIGTPVLDDLADVLGIFQSSGSKHVGYVLQDREAQVLMGARKFLLRFKDYLVGISHTSIIQLHDQVGNLELYLSHLMTKIKVGDRKMSKNLYAVERGSYWKDRYFIDKGTLQRDRDSAALRVFPYQNKLWCFDEVTGKMQPLTTEQNTFKGSKGVAGLVITKEGGVFIFDHHYGDVDPKTDRVNFHSVVAGGASVFFAGSIAVDNGSINEVTNLSGHYRPMMNMQFFSMLDGCGLLNKSLKFDSSAQKALLYLICDDAKLRKSVTESLWRKRQYIDTLKKTSVWSKDDRSFSDILFKYKNKSGVSKAEFETVKEIFEQVSIDNQGYATAVNAIQSPNSLFELQDDKVCSVKVDVVKSQSGGFDRLFRELSALRKANMLAPQITWPNGVFFTENLLQSLFAKGAENTDLNLELTQRCDELERLGIDIAAFGLDFVRAFKALLVHDVLPMHKAMLFHQYMKNHYPEQTVKMEEVMLDKVLTPSAMDEFCVLLKMGSGDELIELLKDSSDMFLSWLNRCRYNIDPELALGLLTRLKMINQESVQPFLGECYKMLNMRDEIRSLAHDSQKMDQHIRVLIQRAEGMGIRQMDQVISIGVFPKVDLAFVQSLMPSERSLVLNDWAKLKKELFVHAIRGHFLRGETMDSELFEIMGRYNISQSSCLRIAYQLKKELGNRGADVTSLSVTIADLENITQPSVGKFVNLVGQLEFSKAFRLLRRSPSPPLEMPYFGTKSSHHVSSSDLSSVNPVPEPGGLSQKSNKKSLHQDIRSSRGGAR